jgi:hypothetical protein
MYVHWVLSTENLKAVVGVLMHIDLLSRIVIRSACTVPIVRRS